MNIFITGTRGVAKSLKELLCNEHSVVCVGRDITTKPNWDQPFHDYDIFINCAHDEWMQVELLELFHSIWAHDPNKKIINIGSSITDYSRADKERDYEHLSYRVRKQALQLTFARLVKTSLCDIKLINPGPIDTTLVKHPPNIELMSPLFIASRIVEYMNHPYIKRVDLWA